MTLRRLAVAAVLCLAAACRDGEPPPGTYPLTTVNGATLPSIYHATIECDWRVDSGLLVIRDIQYTVMLSLRQDCTRAGGSIEELLWPYATTGAYVGGAVVVTLIADGRTVRLVGAYEDGFIDLASQTEILQYLTGRFRFGPGEPLP